MTARTWQQKDVIYVLPENAEEYRAALAMPQSEYLPDYKTFRFPASPDMAHALYEVFGLFGSYYDRGVRDLLRAYKKAPESNGSASPEPWPYMPNFTPWRHQQAAYEYMLSRLNWHGASGLWSGMGTGKSAVLVALVAKLQPFRTLIVCEKNMVETWGRMFADLLGSPGDQQIDYRVVLLPSGMTLKERAQYVRDAEKQWPDTVSVIFVTNYEAVWQRDLGKAVQSVAWDMIALDESHRIKSPGGKVSGFLYRLGKRARYRVCMTGTPSHDKPLDVYAQYRFLDDGIFGTNYQTFMSRYAITVQREKYRQVVGYQNQDELSAKMYTRAFRVPESVLELPPLLLVDRWLELEPEARALYQQFKDELVLELSEGTVSAGNILTKSLRLQQIVNGYVTVKTGYEADAPTKQEKVSQAKYSALEELFDGIPEEEPIVVFGRFLSDLDQIQWAAQTVGRRYVEQSGRSGNWQQWQLKMSSGEVLGVQLQSGGSGIDLTRARYGIYFTTGHSLGQYEQSLRRLHRPGQTKQTTIYHLWAERTIDTIIRSALKGKKDVASLIVDHIRGSI